MKKFYSTLAIAALAASSAVAASPRMSEAVPANGGTFQTLTEAQERVVFTPANATRSGETRAITSAEDICKVYKAPDWWYPLSNDPSVDELNCNISYVEGNMVTLDFNAVSWLQAPIIATVDVAKSTLTIKSDDNAGLYSHDQYGSLDLQLRDVTLTPAEDGDGYNVSTTIVGSITAQIKDDGSIDFGDTCLMWAWSAGGFQFGMGLFTLEPLAYFSFNQDDWKQVGTAKYQDGFLNPLFNAEYQVKEVECPLWVSKSTTGLCLIQNPYYNAAWQEIFEGSTDKVEPGVMVFDLGNPDCVTLNPLVYSGCTLDFGDENTTTLEKMYFYNNEGLMVMGGRSIDSIIEEVEEAMDPFKETIADYLSSYDADNQVVNLRNGLFGMSSNPIANYVWTGTDRTTGLTSKILLPEDFSGIEEVIANDNAPVKYYNLQGMEVKAPEAGQLVIVKKGNKSYKTIAK